MINSVSRFGRFVTIGVAFVFTLFELHAHEERPKAASAAVHNDYTNADDVAAIKALLATYKSGLEKLDVSGLGGLFTKDSQVFESGGVEGTFEHYLEHHIGPELAEFKEFTFGDYTVEVRLEPPLALTTESYTYKIVLKEDGRVIERRGVVTSVFRKTATGWKIIQTHSSSRALKRD